MAATGPSARFEIRYPPANESITAMTMPMENVENSRDNSWCMDHSYPLTSSQPSLLESGDRSG